MENIKNRGGKDCQSCHKHKNKRAPCAGKTLCQQEGRDEDLFPIEDEENAAIDFSQFRGGKERSVEELRVDAYKPSTDRVLTLDPGTE